MRAICRLNLIGGSGAILLLYTHAAAVDISPLFAADDVLDVRLSGPLAALSADTEERIELPFKLEAHGVTHDLEVRIRGHSRLRVCDFAPLRLNFATEETAETVFAGQDKLKLVRPCRDGGAAELDVLEEYLAYRIWNVIDNAGYRVRLLRIAFSDTSSQKAKDIPVRYGFVIESSESVAMRLAAKPVMETAVFSNKYDPAQAAVVYVFQYLIANTDWSLVTADHDAYCCHNLDLYERDAKLIMVPFDFDLSGLVNARYAYPDPSLPIDRVTRRIYRGVCIDTEILRRAVRKVAAKRDAIIGLVDEIPVLTPKQRQKRIRFLDGFFEKTKNEDKLLRNFARRCID